MGCCVKWSNHKNRNTHMTKEEKKKMFEPKKWALYENGQFIDCFDSHAAAKKAKHFKTVEANDDYLDFYYEIKPCNG